ANPPAAPSQPEEAQPVTAAAPAAGPELDLAYGAYQRGYYLSAFNTATQRIEKLGDIKAMTLLGELYSKRYGVMQDDNKAAEWYRLATDPGDREAMFALWMFRMAGRGGPHNSLRG